MACLSVLVPGQGFFGAPETAPLLPACLHKVYHRLKYGRGATKAFGGTRKRGRSKRGKLIRGGNELCTMHCESEGLLQITFPKSFADDLVSALHLDVLACGCLHE